MCWSNQGTNLAYRVALQPAEPVTGSFPTPFLSTGRTLPFQRLGLGASDRNCILKGMAFWESDMSAACHGCRS
jgi:hypothetical protein